jgi:hypothetical protein
MLPRAGVAAVSAVVHRASFAAFGASLAVTLCCFSIATAQTPQPYAQSLSNIGEYPIVSGVPFSEVRTKADTNSLLTEESAIEPASYTSGGRLLSAKAPYVADPCNAGCDVSWYVNYDALWLRREGDSRFSLSRNTILDDFQYEFGGRYTVGRLLDCVNGWEAVYTGPYEWNRQGIVNGAGNLQSQFQVNPLTGFTAADISTFNNANTHVQQYDVEMQSFELNRKWWTWDVLSTLIGIRYVDYDEIYSFASASGAGNGLYSERVDNRMVGAQVGADVMYPVSLRASVGFRGKAGVYANFDERATFLSNAGTVLLNTGDEDVQLAGLIEMGVTGSYQVVPSVRLTCGYEFWYMPGVATVPEQGPAVLSTASGTTVFNEADLFLHGGSIGAQILF